MAAPQNNPLLADQAVSPRWKRAIDVTCCCLAAPAFGLLTLVATIMMRLTSPGPVFFRQERIGLNGRRFRLYKFRTMHVNADTQGHANHFAQLVQTKSPMQKMDGRGDTRLITGAWFIRSSGLDELPQIVNVWRGDMSIVGPRPCIPYEYEQYTELQRERFQSAPGLTGLWQVSGKNRTTFDEMVRLDREYHERKSFWLDVKIILLTVPALLGQILDVVRTRRQISAAKSPVPSAPTSEHVTSNAR
jgi:lipopolysaccharide/colanic/teichoic acid biosynthesis glycosyltransferase